MFFGPIYDVLKNFFQTFCKLFEIIKIYVKNSIKFKRILSLKYIFFQATIEWKKYSIKG